MYISKLRGGKAMFIGRERELQKLNELYNTHKFQFPVIYGRRRVGKTSLINEFVKGKDTILEHSKRRKKLLMQGSKWNKS